MVVRKTHQGIHIPKKYLLGGGIALFCIATAVLAARETLIPKTPPGCEQRYANAGVFAWHHSDGRLYSPHELQARLNGRDWGTLDNVSFRRVDEPDLGSSMDIRLPEEAGRTMDQRKPSGAGFVWTPNWLKGAEQACFGYSFKVPENFNFGSGGSLPGLFGTSQDASGDAHASGGNGFSARFQWRENGSLEIRLISAEEPAGMSFSIDRDRLRIEKGRWLKVENEIILNTPGNADGVLRVWVDGTLKLEQKKIALRTKSAETITGIVSNVHYSTRDLKWAPAPTTTSLSLSPFLIKWQ